MPPKVLATSATTRNHMRTIRGKLLLGIGGLSAATVLLAGTLVAGLNRYAGLANHISAAATRLPHASGLSRAVDRVQNANRRWCESIAGQGMIDTGGLLGQPTAAVHRAGLDAAIVELQITLQRYGRSLPESDTSLLPLVEMVNSIDASTGNPSVMSVDPATRQNLLAMRLERLAAAASTHAARLHRSIAAVTDGVSGDVRTGVFIAVGVFFAVSIGVIALVAFLQTDVIAPFQLLVDGCHLIADEQQYDMRLDLGRDDELGALADAMNQMTDRFQYTCQNLRLANLSLNQAVRDRSDEVIRNEQLASVGFLAAGFAHEINNPMATIAWSAESLESRVSEWQTDFSEGKQHEVFAQLTTGLKRIGAEAFRCSDITKAMLDLSRLSDCRRTPIDVVPLVRDVVAMVGTVGQYRCKTVDVHAETEPMIAHANDPEVRQCVLNLVTNALESVDERGRVDVYLSSVGDWTSIRVVDDGCGMSPEVLRHVFEPFYTRRRDNTGTGLGLSITSRIVSRHGGSLTAESGGEGAGSTFEIRLPSTAATADTPALELMNLHAA